MASRCSVSAKMLLFRWWWLLHYYKGRIILLTYFNTHTHTHTYTLDCNKKLTFYKKYYNTHICTHIHTCTIALRHTHTYIVYFRIFNNNLFIHKIQVTEVDENFLAFPNLEELTLSANKLKTVKSENLPQSLHVSRFTLASKYLLRNGNITN